MFKIELGDHGIRPRAGPADECFYCKTKVGGVHGPECVIVVRLVEYDVIVLGQKVGTFTREDPAHWTEHDCNFHKNDSSWCCDNAADAIKWIDTESGLLAKKKVDEIIANDPEHDTDRDCTCNYLEFRYVKDVSEAFLCKH